MPIYYILSTAEASSNLARYDGVHFGYRSKEITDLESTYKNSRTEGFGTEVKRRIMLGTFVLSSGYNEEFYTKALKIRRLIQDDTKKIFKAMTYSFHKHLIQLFNGKKIQIQQKHILKMFLLSTNLSGNPALAAYFESH